MGGKLIPRIVRRMPEMPINSRRSLYLFTWKRFRGARAPRVLHESLAPRTIQRSREHQRSSLMRKSLAISAVLLAAAMYLFVGQRLGRTETRSSTPTAESPSVASEDRLIVHEWGTFTSFSGSDGVRLEFRPLVDSDLPDFVINRAKQVGAYSPDLAKGRWLVRERMETPV